LIAPLQEVGECPPLSSDQKCDHPSVTGVTRRLHVGATIIAGRHGHLTDEW
jgi:hypothetical protein